jgi:hypothetical protein
MESVCALTSPSAGPRSLFERPPIPASGISRRMQSFARDSERAEPKENGSSRQGNLPTAIQVSECSPVSSGRGADLGERFRPNWPLRSKSQRPPVSADLGSGTSLLPDLVRGQRRLPCGAAGNGSHLRLGTRILPGFCVVAQTFSLPPLGESGRTLINAYIATLYILVEFGTMGALNCARRSSL